MRHAAAMLAVLILLCALPEAVRGLPFLHYAICVNGAQVVDAETGRTLCRADIPHERGMEVFRTLSALPGVAEGLERRIFRCAAAASTREELLDALKCKRYTRARLSRILACALLGLTNALAERHPEPEYARLMGMRRDARPLLSELKRRAKLPIVSDPVRLQSDECFRLECRATDLRALQCDDPSERRAGQELTRKFVMVE